MEETFGQYFKRLRGKIRMPLREFCRKNGFDPGNISKLERDVMPAPQDEKLLEKYARALKITKDSDEWIEFTDKAAVSHGSLSMRHIKHKPTVERLPIIFRTISDKKLTEEQLEKLIEHIKNHP